MSNEFKPGHPVIFWLTMVALTFAFYSGAKAVITLNDCGSAHDDKTWQVFPPEWECR
jgi:hypothetical protein